MKEQKKDDIIFGADKFIILKLGYFFYNMHCRVNESILSGARSVAFFKLINNKTEGNQNDVNKI